MGQDVRNDSRVCRTPPGPRKDLNWHLKPRKVIMAVGLSFMLTTSLMYYLMLPPAIPPAPPPPFEPPTPLQLTPHDSIAIDGDANFSATALLEGWPGDGSPEDPYIIDGLDIDLGGAVGNCISIYNSRVSFIIRNCSLNGKIGILLENVMYGELVENTCNSDDYGIRLQGSDSNTVANNTCTSNIVEYYWWAYGIRLSVSSNNILANNTCTNNSGHGIWLFNSGSNTVANNTCNSNGKSGIYFSVYMGGNVYNTVINNTCNRNGESGICFTASNHNTVANNTCCYNTEYGVSLRWSEHNTVANNTCFSNGESGISLEGSDPNTVANNTCLNNTEHDIIGEYMTEEDGTEESGPEVLLFIGFAGIIMLGAGWKLLSGIREFN